MFKQKSKIPTTVKRLSLVAILAVATMASFLVVFGQNNKVQAATSSTINFQARLLTAAGAVVPDGQYNVEFKLYTALTSSGSSQGSCTGDANCVWVETRTSGNTVRVVDGYLTVNLGSVNAFSSSINWDQQLYLSMNIGGTSVTPSWDGEMSPRLLLTAVPYAFRAGTLIGGTGANTTTLDTGTPSGNNTIHLPAASGTVCLQSSTACGFASSTGSGSYIQNGTSVQTAANFAIRSAATGSVVGVLQGGSGQTADLFDVQTWNGTSATNVFSVNNVGAITLNGTGTTNFTTPQGSSIPTKISVPLYDPGSFGQVIAMGVPSTANSTARVMSLLDGRTAAHQPTLAVFNPNESDAVGFNWNGTNNLANVQTIDLTSGSTNGVSVRSGNISAGNGGSGVVYLQSGSIAGGAGGYASGNVILQSGNAAGTTANSGNVQIDVGTATGTKGSILIGTTNAPTITLGNSAAATNDSLNLYGNVLVKSPNGNASAFQVQPAGSSTPLFNVDTQNSRVGVGGAASFSKFEVLGGDAAIYNNGGNPRLILGNSTAGGQNGYLQYDSTNHYFRIETVGTNGLKINDNYVSIGNIYPGQPLTVGNGSTQLFQITTTGTVQAQSTTNSTTAFQFQNSGGTDVLNVDTTNNRIGVGTNAPSRTIDTEINTTSTNTLPLLLSQSGTGDVGLQLQTTSQSFYMGIDSTDSKLKISSAASANGTFTQGDTTQEVGTPDYNTNGAQASKFTATGSGTVSSASVYITAVDATPANRLIQVGLYADNAGVPGARLGSSSSVTAVVGWNTISFSGASITSGTSYWIAMAENGANKFAQATSGGTMSYNTTTGYPLPTPFGQTATSANKPSFYITVANTGSTDNFAGTNLYTMSDSGQVLYQNSANSTTAFQVQNASGTGLFDADTSNGRIGIGTTAPAYTLDVAGDVNIGSSNAYRIGGTSICTSSGCTASSTSAILNQNAAQQASSNFWISGTGRADTGIQSPSFDTPSGTATLQLGMTNATALELGHSTFFASGANRTFYIAAPGSGNGNNLSVQAGSGAGTNASGGSLILQGGNNTGTGTAGAVIVKPQTDTANAFQVQNAAGTTNVLNVGTTNSLVTINGDINFTGLQPASTSGSGTAAANWFMTSGAGGNTTGTTGQTAGNGSTIFIAGGNGGTAPAGSTNGSGGNVYISGGTAGAGAGSAGFRGNVILQSGGGAVGVGTASPNQAYKIDAAGDINISSGSAYRINGTAICTSSGCTPASGSSYYIQNQYSTVQSANVRIQTTSDTVNTMTLQSTANQNNGSNQSDLLEFQSSTGGLMAGVTPIGTIWSAPISTLAGVPTTARMFIQANSTASNSVVIRTSALGTGVSSDAGPLRVQNKDGSIDIFDINGDGSVTHRLLTDSTTAFQLQNASGVSLFNLNTTSYSATFGSSATGGGLSSLQVQTTTGSESTLSFLSGSAPSSSNIKFVLSKRSDNTSFWLYGYDNTTFVNYMKVDGVNHYINFVPDGTGAVGIGTTTPSRELDVKVNNTSTNALPVIVEQGGGAGDSGIEIKNTTANYYAGIDTSDSSAFKINSYASSAGSILGFDGVSYATDSGDSNNMNATQFTAAKSGTITNLYAYVGSTSVTGNGQMAIYTDNGSNAPGTKIASSASVAVTTGWNAYTISSTSVTAGTKYWLAYNTNGSSSQNNLNADWSQGSSYYVAQTFGTWPATWTAGGTSYPGIYDLYAPITASSAPTDNWSTQLLRLSQTGALTLQNNQNSTTALQVLNDNSLSVFSVDTTNDVVRINGPNATQSGGRLYFGDLQNVYIGEYGNSDTDQLALYGNSGINMGTSAGNYALSIVNGTWNGNTIGMVGINTNTPSDPLTVNGNFTVRDSDTVTKEYRFRTTGSALDFEGSGADLYLSDWSTAGFTGTQYTAMILSHSSSRIDVKSTYTYFNPTTTSGDVIDVNRSSAGTLIGFALSGTIQGSISVSGTTVSYNAFTGSHFALTNENIDRSMLVSMTGVNQRRDPTDMTSEPYYGITKTSKANDPAVLGSFLAPLDPSKPVSMDNPDQVMSVGNGDMWVDDEGGNINPGDYLISSNVAGYAMKDTGQFAESNIVGRASDPVDWTNETAVVNGHKVKRIEVLYTQFTRMNATGLAMGLASGGIVSNDVTFNGLVTFSKAVTFQSDVSMLGHITVGDNTAGTVDIPAGQTSVSVTFSSPYDKAPKVTTGVSDFVDVAVGNKSGKGFTIQIPSARSTDTYVDWTALATP